jgi:hypothetical protein
MKFDDLSYVHVLMASGREHFLPPTEHERVQKAVDTREYWYRTDNIAGQPVAFRPVHVESLTFVTPTTRAQERAFLAVVYPDEWEGMGGPGGEGKPDGWRPT